MSRIRTIKPDFFKHEGLFDLEQESGLPVRLAFSGLWTQCDREGRFAWRPRQLKTDILPYDDVDFSLILDALAGRGFVVKYVVDGEVYGYVPSWGKHQVVNVREAKSRIPEPPDTETHVHVTETHVHAHALRGQNIPQSLAVEIFDRDGGKCLRCGSTEDLTIDHIFPRSMGGTHASTNLRTLCRSCNSGRPVAGEAFVKDLARDGLTLDDMKRMCTHVHAPCGKERKGKGREGVQARPAARDELTLNGHSPTPRSELQAVLDLEHASAVIDHRQRMRKPLTPHAAKLLADKFAKVPNPNAAADAMIANGWQGFEPEWLERRKTGPPTERDLDSLGNAYRRSDPNEPPGFG